MTRKFILQLGITLTFLALLWLLISQINFREIFKVERRLQQVEEQLGRWTLRFLKNEYFAVDDPRVHSLMADLTHIMFESNDFQKDIDFLFLRNDDVNALAIPGNTVIFFTGMIHFTQTPEEFLGIVAHEIAHLEQNHVIKKLSKEIGIAALMSILSGNINISVVRDLVKILTSTAYDRNLEREADAMAVEYLINAGIDPNGFVEVLKRFSEEIDTMPKELRWMSTHPDSKERALLLMEKIETYPDLKEVEFIKPDQELWKKFKEIIGSQKSGRN